MRVPLGKRRVQARLGQQPGHPLGEGGPRYHLVGAQDLRDRGPDRHPGIEAVVRVLEHDLRVAAVRLEPGAAQRADVLASERDGAAGRAQQAEDGAPDRRLA